MAAARSTGIFGVPAESLAKPVPTTAQLERNETMKLAQVLLLLAAAAIATACNVSLAVDADPPPPIKIVYEDFSRDGITIGVENELNGNNRKLEATEGEPYELIIAIRGLTPAKYAGRKFAVTCRFENKTQTRADYIDLTKYPLGPGVFEIKHSVTFYKPGKWFVYPGLVDPATNSFFVQAGAIITVKAKEKVK